MKFRCKEISINNDDLGCQITFSEKDSLGEKADNVSVQEIIDSTEEYLLIQCSCTEDEYESDYIYFETHNEEYSGELCDYKMTLSKELFSLKLSNGEINVLINPTENDYSELKNALTVLTNNSKKLIIND